MGRNHPRSLTPREVERILRQAGAQEAGDGGKGDHKKYHRWIDGRRYTIIVDQGKEIPLGTLQSIARQAKLDMRTFWALYHDSTLRLSNSSEPVSAS